MARDRAMDAARGCAIASMVTAHLASGTLIARALHPVPYFDGASVFILLSGLLLGLIGHMRAQRARTVRAAVVSAARRMRIIYFCQLVLCALAVAMSVVNTTPVGLRPISDAGGPLQSIWLAVSLQYAAPGGNVLRLYVLLMLFALLAYVALQAGRYVIVLAASALLYVVGIVFDGADWFYLPTFNEAGFGASWITWQALFVPALVLGWLWQEKDVPNALRRHWQWVIALAVVVMIVCNVASRFEFLLPLDEFLDGKVVLGPGRLISAYAITAAGYLALGWLLATVVGKVLAPIELIGQRSLDSYVLQAIAVLLIPLVLGPRSDWPGAIAMVIAIAVLVGCWAWAWVRKRFGIEKLHRGPKMLSERRGKTALT